MPLEKLKFQYIAEKFVYTNSSRYFYLLTKHIWLQLQIFQKARLSGTTTN